MSIITWLWDRFGQVQPAGTQIAIDACDQEITDYQYRKLAFWAAVRVLAAAVSKCEVRTYVRGQEVKTDEYYMLNVRPNRNQNATRFWQDALGKLMLNNEVLIIEDPSVKGNLLVADSYEIDKRAVIDWRFSNIEVSDYKIAESYWMSQVIFLQYNNENINDLLKRMYRSYEKLIQTGINAYGRGRGRKGVLNLDALRGGSTDERNKEADMINQRFRKMFEAENGIVPLEKGQTFTDLTSTTRNIETSRDLRAMIDDIYDLTARAFGIHGALLHGEVAGIEPAGDFTLTYALEPLIGMIQEEFNAKRIGRAEFRLGTRYFWDIKSIEHYGLKQLGTNGDKIIASGGLTIDELRRYLGEPAYGKEWSQMPWQTLNNELVTRPTKQKEVARDDAET